MMAARAERRNVQLARHGLAEPHGHGPAGAARLLEHPVGRVQPEHFRTERRRPLEGPRRGAGAAREVDEPQSGSVADAVHEGLGRDAQLPVIPRVETDEEVVARGAPVECCCCGHTRSVRPSRVQTRMVSVTIAQPKPKSSMGMSHGNRRPDCCAGL